MPTGTIPAKVRQAAMMLLTRNFNRWSDVFAGKPSVGYSHAGTPNVLKCAPSSIEASEVNQAQGDQDRYSICCADYALQAALAFFKPEATDHQKAECEEVYGRLAQLCREDNPEQSFGYFSESNKGNSHGFSEQTITSFLPEELKPLVALNESDESVRSWSNRMRFLHQPHFANPSSNGDVVVYEMVRKADLPAHSYLLNQMRDDVFLHPMMVIEFGKGSSYTLEKKRAQLSAYANILFNQMPTKYKHPIWTPLLGVTMIDMSSVEVKVFSNSLRENGVMVPEILIYSGPLEAHHFLGLVQLMHKWISICSTLLRRTTGSINKRGDFAFDTNLCPIPKSNVIQIGERIYKVFDMRTYGSLPCVRKHDLFIDHEFINIKGMVQNVKEEFTHQGRCLVLISYDYVKGDHTPSKVHQLLSVLLTVLNMHDAGYVHGDIRMYNVVFPEASDKLKLDASYSVTQASAVLIDYDLADKVDGTASSTYPARFNCEIHDGGRHPDAKPNQPKEKVHDVYSVWRLFCCCTVTEPDPQNIGLWDQLLKYLKGLWKSGNIPKATEVGEVLRDRFSTLWDKQLISEQLLISAGPATGCATGSPKEQPPEAPIVKKVPKTAATRAVSKNQQSSETSVLGGNNKYHQQSSLASVNEEPDIVLPAVLIKPVRNKATTIKKNVDQQKKGASNRSYQHGKTVPNPRQLPKIP